MRTEGLHLFLSGAQSFSSLLSHFGKNTPFNLSAITLTSRVKGLGLCVFSTFSMSPLGRYISESELICRSRVRGLSVLAIALTNCYWYRWLSHPCFFHVCLLRQHALHFYCFMALSIEDGTPDLVSLHCPLHSQVYWLSYQLNTRSQQCSFCNGERFTNKYYRNKTTQKGKFSGTKNHSDINKFWSFKTDCEFVRIWYFWGNANND